MRRGVKFAVWALGGVLAAALLIAAAVLVAGNSAAGRTMIEQATLRLTAGRVQLAGLGGSFPTDLTLRQLILTDDRGTWLTAEGISVHWFPLALIEHSVRVDRLRAARVEMERRPFFRESGGAVSIPVIDVEQVSIDVVELGAELAGTRAKLSARGRVRLDSLQDAIMEVAARRIGGDGEYTLHLKFDPKRMDARLELHEPAGGPLENILQLPGLGALSATARLEGPRAAERFELALTAGETRARAAGEVNVQSGAADLEYSIDSPALRPRADLAWRRVSLEGSWHGSLSEPKAQGHLAVWDLEAGAARAESVSAELAASGGELTLEARAAGVSIPGSQPDLLRRDPVLINATVRMDAASRPLVLSAWHRLFSLEARGVTAGAQRFSLDLKLPDVAPFAAYLGEDVRGAAGIKAEIARRPADLSVSIDAGVELTGGAASWVPLIEGRAALKASGALSDRSLDIEKLELRAPSISLDASGRAMLRPSGAAADGGAIERLEIKWRLDATKLSLLAPELDGGLRAAGTLRGAPAALEADAALSSTLSVHGSPAGMMSGEIRARGIPSALSGTVQLHGMLDGAPLTLDARLERGAGQALRAQVRAAEWKSAHLEGEMAIAPARMEESRGQMHLTVAELGDFDRVLGVNLGGGVDANIDFTPVQGRAHAQFQLIGRDVRAGSFAAGIELKGEGAPNSMALALAIHAANLMGAPAELRSSAQLDLDAGQLRLVTGAARYRGEELKLLSPAHVLFGKALSIDRLELGMRGAVLAIDGDLLPALDLRASLRHFDPALVNAFIPDFLAAGTVEAQMQLTGRIGAPSGEMTLTARGLRSASPQAAGFPALDLDGKATLTGDAASVDIRLSAAGKPVLAATGSVPLDEQGTLGLEVAGSFDIALASALFEARGMQASGQLTVDAHITGTSSAPTVQGRLTLAHGKWRDYVRGSSLSDISAELTGSGATLKLVSFKANTASGTLSMTGTIGVLQPGIPVDLALTAANAQPIASTLFTARLDAKLRIRGSATEHIDIAGSLHVNRALIGIPDALPPEVAVLDVRRRGQAAAPPTSPFKVGFDVTIDAPQEVLVQGRGLDAELGGEVHIGGSLDAPLVNGGFDLRRGSVSIAGSRLNFTAGRVSFGGAGLRNRIDPILDFTAQNTYNDITATLRITGYADSPRFEFSSVPTQPQDDILAILLFGQPATTLSPLQAAQIAAALSGTGEGLNPLTKIQRALGFDRLTVSSATTTTATGATQNTGAAIGAGRYISKRVYVEAKQTSTGQSQVEVDVELTRHLKIQTRLGNGTAITQGTTPDNDPGSSVALTYQFEY